MSVVSAFVVVAGASIDLGAIWLLLRGRKATSVTEIRAITNRARILAAIACLLGLVVPVTGAAFALNTIESVAPDQRAVALTERISAAMDGGILPSIFAMPSLLIALFLMARSRTIQRQSGAPESDLGPP
jgi:cytochrome bd-type quinol oxidase subunit 2